MINYILSLTDNIYVYLGVEKSQTNNILNWGGILD